MKNKQKKLLIFHPYLAPYRIDLYNALAKAIDLKVLLLGSDAEISTLGFDLDRVNKLAEFDFSYYKKGFRVGRHLISTIYWKVINGFRPDIVLAHELGINTLVAILLKRYFGYKLYITMDDSPFMAQHYDGKRDKLRQFVMSRIDGVLVVNPAVKLYLEDKYKDMSCKFLYFPIIQDDEVLTNKIIASKSVSEEYGDKYRLNDKKVILFVGRLEKIKSPDLLVKVFASMNNPETILVLVGNGSLFESLKTYVVENHLEQKIILTGALSGKALYAWYYRADIFILPSKFEPFGAVVNEALVAGCRTIVSNYVGASSLIDSKNGYVFDYSDENGLRLCITQALKAVSANKKHYSLMNKSFQEYFEELKDFMQI